MMAMCVLSLLLLVVMLVFCPSPGEEDVRIDVVGTDCKHGVSLRAARAAGRGQLATDAIVDVLKLGDANNSDMHERKILLVS